MKLRKLHTMWLNYHRTEFFCKQNNLQMIHDPDTNRESFWKNKTFFSPYDFSHIILCVELLDNIYEDICCVSSSLSCKNRTDPRSKNTRHRLVVRLKNYK